MMASETPDKKERNLFATMARQLTMLADQVEDALARDVSPETFLGRKTYDPFPTELQVALPD